MKRSLPVLIALILLCSTVGWSADYQKGYEALLKKDYATALREFKPLAEEGHAAAQCGLGLMYHKGKGVPESNTTAVNWFRLAALQEHAEGQHWLGSMYALGKGVPQDYQTAGKWFRRAAEQGFAFAQFSLAGMYGRGLGVPESFVYAHMWFNVAASQGDEEAAKNRALLVNKMTPSQIERAQFLASECVKKKYKGCGRPKR